MAPHAGRPRASDLADQGIDTRQNILDAFSRLVAEQGYDATSVSAVAALVGVSKGTIVHHFPTKELMLQESHLQYIHRRVEEMSRILTHVGDPRLQLTAMIYCIARAHRDDRAGTIAFLREFARFASSPLADDLRALRAEYTSMMTSIVRRARVAGVFHTEDPSLTALQVFGMCNYMWTWYRPENRATAERIAAVFADNILNGLTTPRPAADDASDGRPSRLSVDELQSFIETLRPLLAPAQTNKPTRLVAGQR